MADGHSPGHALCYPAQEEVLAKSSKDSYRVLSLLSFSTTVQFYGFSPLDDGHVNSEEAMDQPF